MSNRCHVHIQLDQKCFGILSRVKVNIDQVKYGDATYKNGLDVDLQQGIHVFDVKFDKKGTYTFDLTGKEEVTLICKRGSQGIIRDTVLEMIEPVSTNMSASSDKVYNKTASTPQYPAPPANQSKNSGCGLVVGVILIILGLLISYLAMGGTITIPIGVKVEVQGYITTH